MPRGMSVSAFHAKASRIGLNCPHEIENRVAIGELRVDRDDDIAPTDC